MPAKIGSEESREGSQSNFKASIPTTTKQKFANIANWKGFRWILSKRDLPNISAARNPPTTVVATADPPTNLAMLDNTRMARKTNGMPHNRLRWNLR